MEGRPWRRHLGGRETLGEESHRRHPGGNWEAPVSMHKKVWRGIMGEASWERNQGGGIMGGGIMRATWRRNHGEGIMEGESWRAIEQEE